MFKNTNVVEKGIPSQKQNYGFMDGWRGLAIIWIVLGHISTYYDYNASTQVRKFLNLLSMPVDIFLILSGFFITSELLAKEKVDMGLF